MVGARVGIFEDHPFVRELAEGTIGLAGHFVVISAQSLEQAKVAIDQYGSGLDVALVDGDLGSGTEDGPQVIQWLRAASNAYVIGHSTLGMVEGSDADVKKLDFRGINLLIQQM